MNYYPHHIGDFNNATRHLSRVERSLYRDMIDMYYDTEQPLTADFKLLCRKLLARTEEEVTAVEQVLNEFFTQGEQGWVHARCEQVIAEYREQLEKKSAAGKASAEARAAAKAAAEALKTQGKQAKATAVEQPLNTRSTNQEPRTKNQGSVPIGTGGEPPSGQDETAKDPAQMTKDELWTAGKSLLAQQGMPAAQCGTFVGKLVKDYGAEIVVEAVRAAVVERPADAVSFLKASCMARKGEGGKTLIPWHATDAGVIAKGEELGIRPLPGETPIVFKQRVIAAVDNGGKPPASAPKPAVTTAQSEPQRVAVDNSPEAKAARSEALKAALKAKEAA